MKNIISILVSSTLLYCYPVHAQNMEPVSPRQLAAVHDALGDAYPIVKVACLRSVHHKNAFYIGAAFTAKGFKDKLLGVWLISGPKNNPGLLLSVNDTAHRYSGLKKASEIKGGAYATDSEAQALITHLQ